MTVRYEYKTVRHWCMTVRYEYLTGRYSWISWFNQLLECMTVRSLVYDRQVFAPDGQAKVFLLVMTQCNGAI